MKLGIVLMFLSGVIVGGNLIYPFTFPAGEPVSVYGWGITMLVAIPPLLFGIRRLRGKQHA